MSAISSIRGKYFHLIVYKFHVVFCCQNEEQNTGTEPTVSHDVATTADILHEMDVDDLLKYINGDDDKSQAKMMTRKAAKRARQKQRKVSTTPLSYCCR